MPKFFIYRGVPGSGKSTEALKYAENDNAFRVNRDDIRKTHFGRYWGMDEQIVTKFFEAALRTAFGTGQDVISDNTNLVAKHVKRQIEIAQGYGYEIEFHDFPISKNEAIERDANREKQVGEKVIESFFTRFVSRKDGLSLPPVPMFEAALPFEPYEYKEGLPRAILVDIDGTLAHHEGIRSPYDTSKYHLDDFDYDIAAIAQAWRLDLAESGMEGSVIIMSGRDAEFRGVLEKWLMVNGGWYPGNQYHGVFMRPEGDKRNDAIVKNELFEKHIAGKYNVDFVLDDRNRVVSMWRAKGLKVLQVADGDF